MRAVTWQGREKVAVTQVPDPALIDPTDAIVEISSTAICGSDLHLYAILGPYLDPGDVLGHEAMGRVVATGSAVRGIRPGDRVVIPFNISCGACFMCERGLQSQCETTQVHSHGKGGALFGYTRLYGQVAGGQAEYVRVPLASYGLIKVPDDGSPDERYLYLSDVLPTAWQAVEYAGLEPGQSLAVVGLGPIGQMCVRIARHRGAGLVIGIDPVRERREMAERHGCVTLEGPASDGEDFTERVRELTKGRGPDAVIDAVGIEAHGAPFASAAQRAAGMLPKPLARAAIGHFGIDRLTALHAALALVRRGGTVSISGVYGGAIDAMPMMEVFDKQLTLRAGQANVRRWTDTLLPLVTDPADPLAVLDLRTHRLPLDYAPSAYRKFQRKEDGFIKVVLDPRQPSDV